LEIFGGLKVDGRVIDWFHVHITVYIEGWWFHIYVLISAGTIYWIHSQHYTGSEWVYIQ